MPYPCSWPLYPIGKWQKQKEPLGLGGHSECAAVGGIFYTGQAIGSGEWNWGSFGTTVGMGALTGLTGGAATSYFIPRIAFGAGIYAGCNGW